MKRILSLILSVVCFFTVCLSGCQNKAESTFFETTNVSKESSSKYSSADNWVYADTDSPEKEADVFFLCPTSFDGEDKGFYNMPLDNEEIRQKFKGQVNMEKGIYDDNCRFFAPYYSQIGMNVYDMSIEEREPFLKIAFADVKDAFEYYIENYNEGRPVVLAGFSQGADMCLRLLKECFAEKSLQNQLVACYAIGWRITDEELAEYPHLKFSQGENDTGVIISFNTEAEKAENSLMIPKGMKTKAINPLNWKTDTSHAPKELNLGSCFTDYDGNVTKEAKNLTGAYIDSERGALKVTDINEDNYPGSAGSFERGVYHSYDFQFFYRNLEKNVQDRIKAFLEND